MINTPKELSDIEVGLYKSGYWFCENLVKEKHITIAVAVEKTAAKFGGLNMISDMECFKKFLFSEVTAYTEPSIGVCDPNLEDKTWWDELKQDPKFKPEYWSRYYDYLLRKPSWSITAVEDINSSTDEIMNALTNPRKGVAGERMGMVFGYVQSGKTAHYIGMINKAYDAGYRIVIVLSGIHNSLRSQTQSRIDEEVLGYETSLESIEDMTRERNVIGVGVGPHNQVETVVQSITTRDEKGDVNKKTEGVSMMPPFMIVTKKNASVLRKILRFFRKNHCAEIIGGKKKIPAKYPALIIDDEADQASINTKESYDDEGNVLDDYNPTTINGLIRELLGVFECRSYIGYTATPFANIFIPPHIDDEKYGTDLFPRDFIYRSPRADQYIGAREFFGLGSNEDIPAMPLYRKIVDGATYLGRGTKSTDLVGELPKELKLAVKYFLLSTALRNCRGQRNKPNTMLIHIVRFVDQQNKVKQKVLKYFKEEIENHIRYGDPIIESELKVNKGIKASLVSEPQMFMAYNNGISTVADGIDIDESHSSGDVVTITEITGWQIVNGGQTTASIYNAYKSKLPLDQVNVQIKLSVIKKKDQAEDIIHNISKYANSQNKINMSDFNANDAYHVKMERLSRATPIPVARGKSTDYWFYERARGQYLVELSRQPTAAAKKEFKSRCPKNRCISKTVAAKCVMAYQGYPYIVSKGLETSFVYFSDMVSKGEFPEPSEQSYIDMISKVIVFNSCDEIIKNLKFGGFKAQQDYYTVALIGKYYSGLINPQEIWNNQTINAETARVIEELAYFVWEHFQNPTVPGVNIGQWCKKEDCWELLQSRYEAKMKKREI